MLYSWLYSLLVSGCICSLILFLNADGKLKNLLETGCACVMILTFLSPFVNLPPIRNPAQSFSQWSAIESNNTFSDVQSEKTQAFMESQYRAYILKEAAHNNVLFTDVMIQTTLNENGYWIPVSVEYIADSPIAENFKQHIADELGITEER